MLASCMFTKQIIAFPIAQFLYPASWAAVRKALASAANGQEASYWDSLLVATQAEAGCTTILTEDGVRVLNPFGAGALTPDAAALLATG
jgi:hypothetical protein